MRCGREETVPKLKVCGITDAAFAVEAARRGVDYLGLIFAEGSPRRVTVEQAREIVDAVRGAKIPCPRFAGVFAEHAADVILRMAGAVPLDVIQLHCACDADKVARVKAKGFEVWRLYDAAEGDVCKDEDAVLLDGRDGNRCGGTGKNADWSLVAKLKRAGRRVVLAGGISSLNIAAAVATGADVIDVNSALETAPGVKSVDRLEELFAVFTVTRKCDIISPASGLNRPEEAI